MEAPGVYAAPNDSDVFGTLLWPGDANNVATDGQRVFFTASDGLLHGVDVDGGSPFAIGTASAGGSYSVALASGSVYWSVSPSASIPDGLIKGASYLVDASTISPGPVTTIATVQNLGQIATDGTDIYWIATVNTDAGTTTGAVFGCAIASCTPTMLASEFTQLVDIVSTRRPSTGQTWGRTRSPTARYGSSPDRRLGGTL